MKYAIHKNTLSSVFQDSSEKSKQTSQLLFGELCLIKSERNEFLYIENLNDKHSGWVLKKSFLIISEDKGKEILKSPLMRVCMPLVEAFNLSDKTIFRLPAGSVITNYDSASSKFSLLDIEYQIHPSFVSYLPYGNMEGVSDIALSFLNAPYMFGGKSILGIDKAGFVQLVFNLCGYTLPRCIQDQTNVGVPVYSIEQVRQGDLIFLNGDNETIDVFIYLGDEKAIGMQDEISIINIDTPKIETSISTIRRLV